MLKQVPIAICVLSLWASTLKACMPALAPEATSKPPAGSPTALPVTDASAPTFSTVSVPQATTEQPLTVQEKALLDFILNHLAVKGNRPHLIAQVPPMDEAIGYPVDVTQVPLLHCWVYQQRQFTPCERSTFLTNLDHDEQNPPWQYSYAIFSISSVNADYTTATIRLDYFSGPKASSGTSVILKKVNGQWEVESQKPIWVS